MWSRIVVGFERNRVLGRLLVAFAFFAIVVLLFARTAARELNHDEHQFIAPPVLLLREGLLPYRDYPYFHMPNLIFVFAPLFATTSHLFLAARSFNTFCAALLLLIVFATAARRFRAMEEMRWVIALSFVLVLSLNPFFRYTAGRAWNHDLPVLASIGAFLTLLHAGTSKRGLLWMGLSGALLGAAIGTRLSFAPLLAPFFLLAFFFSARGFQRISYLTSLTVGLGVALLPTALLFFAAPSQFIFGNFTYNGTLNPLYHASLFPGEFALLRKFAFPLQQLLKSPCDLALVVGFIYFGLRPWWRAGWRNISEHRETVALGLILLFLFLGCLAATPSHRQYYYALVPFLLLGNIYGIARNGKWRVQTSWLVIATVFSSLLEATPDLRSTRTILRPTEWPVVTVHARAEQMRELLGGGRVLTLAPIFPLEANLQIYPELACSPFVWRTATFVDKPTQAANRILDPADLEEFFRSAPPSAILTDFEHADIESPLVTYAKAHSYKKHNLEERGGFWLPRK
jgi:4-amino-4-deoxy-L-arabinose transferase-like glycosyltransferase